MRMTTMTWLILVLLCGGLTGTTDGVSLREHGSGDSGGLAPPDALRLHSPCASDGRPLIQTTGGISLSGSKSGVRQPLARGVGAPGPQAVRDSGKRPAAQTARGGSQRNSRRPDPSFDEQYPTGKSGGDGKSLFVPPIEEACDNQPANSWNRQKESWHWEPTEAGIGESGNEDPQNVSPAKPTRTAWAMAGSGMPNAHVALKNNTGIAPPRTSFPSLITGALALAAVLLPTLLAIWSSRAGHAGRAKTASRSRRVQQVRTAPPVVLAGLPRQKPHDQPVDATHQGEPPKIRRAA